MAIYSVMVPRNETSSIAAADKTVLVADRFNLSAAFLGPFWLLYQRNWRGFLAWILFMTIGILVVLAGHLPLETIVWSLWAAALFIGLQANTLVEAALARQGYQLVDVVTGKTRAEAERIFFRRKLSSNGNRAATAFASAIYSGESIVGLFPFPEARA